jgi:prepilin peptidase CpaA
MSVVLILLVAGTLSAAAIDLRCRRIPNVLTATMACAAISLHLFDGTTALALAIVVMIAAFALGTLAFSAGWFGGGDVKLIAAACGLVGYPGALSLVLFILVAGAVLALAEVTRQRRLVSFVRNTVALATTGCAPETATLLPYGVAIAGGSVAYAASTLIPGLRLPL